MLVMGFVVLVAGGVAFVDGETMSAPDQKQHAG
jgi:hypothetical protein